VKQCKVLYIVFTQDEVALSETSSTAGLGSDASQHDATDAELQLMEQEKMLHQLKDMIREREESLAKKDAELQVCSWCSFT